MRKKTLRVLSRIMCIVLLASIVLQAPLFAVETIPVRVNGQTFRVTPGQWVTVRSGTSVSHYNVRFINGRPVALEMSQYTKLVFGKGAVAGASSVADNVAQTGSSHSSTSAGASTADDVAAAGNPYGNSNSPNGVSQSTQIADNTAHSGSTSHGSIQSSQSGSTPHGSSQSTQNGSTAGSVADDVAQSGSTSQGSSQSSVQSSQQTAGSVADDAAATSGGKVGIAGRFKNGWKAGKAAAGKIFGVKGGKGSSSGSTSHGSSQSTQSGSTAGSVADDVAQSGSTSHGSSQSTQSGSTAGSVADDVAQSGSTSHGSSQSTQSGSTAGSVADDVAQSGSTSQGSSQSSVQSSQQTAGSVADDAAQSGSTSAKRAWDPARHPRDPQTGRFISRQEAIERGIISPDGSTAGSVADDVAQSGSKTGSVADDVAQNGTAKPGLKDRFKSGYKSGKKAAGKLFGTKGKKGAASGKVHTVVAAGRGMVSQGFNNVKTSLKSGFSAKNLLVTAGITVGVDLATQIMRGEKPSAKKALKTVCSAEFVGGVGGAVVGAAAGSFFVPFLSAIPVVGGALSALAPTFGSIVGSSVGAYTAGDLKNGRFSIKEAFKKIDWVGVAGQTIGSTAGAALGSALGPVGTIVGGIVGGYVGNWAAQKVANFMGKKKDGTANLPDIAMPSGAGNPYGAYTGGEVSIGGNEAVVAAPVAASNNNDEAVIDLGGDSASIGTQESEVALAYSKYQELYQLYNDMVSQGRQKDARAVAVAMNKAKAEYDALKASSGK